MSSEGATLNKRLKIYIPILDSTVPTTPTVKLHSACLTALIVFARISRQSKSTSEYFLGDALGSVRQRYLENWRGDVCSVAQSLWGGESIGLHPLNVIPVTAAKDKITSRTAHLLPFFLRP